MQYLFSKGNCQFCATKLAKPSFKKATTLKPNFKPKPKNKELTTFFELKILQLYKTRRSEESGLPIPHPTRGNICHLLDKSRHPSVASHSENYVFLTWDEHARFDQLLFAHDFKKIAKEFPNSWPTVLKRLESVIPACTEQTKFLEALENLTEL